MGIDDIVYNQDLSDLECILANVEQLGDFFVSATKEIPMPKVEIENVGVLAFPLTEMQIQQMIQQANHAPYGRGDETLLDLSVRNCWQIEPQKIQVGGKSWPKQFAEIITEVKAGLGCSNIEVDAELYKMLVYESGSFFLPHRDSEKSSGMFATMVIVLPSEHSGGELIISHAGQTETLKLNVNEPSELAYAAFYADCTHEIKPITDGYRVCLVYNLIKLPNNSLKLPSTPSYQQEVNDISQILKRAFTPDNAPIKLVWLLEHQYTQAELSFSNLKNKDAAVASLMLKATEANDCAIFLGIIHISESGSAEPEYSGRYRGGYDYFDEREVSSDDYEIIDVCDWDQYIDSWVDKNDQKVEFALLPIEEGELLPAGALANEEPDEQRLLEATGNAGVSYERAYHRAAIIIWRNENHIQILLQQSGILPAISYFKQIIQQANQNIKAYEAASLIIDKWVTLNPDPYYRKPSKTDEARSEMLLCLNTLHGTQLLSKFIDEVVTKHYDGSENKALAQVIFELEKSQANLLLSNLIKANFFNCPDACINLLAMLINKKEANIYGLAADLLNIMQNFVTISYHQTKPTLQAATIIKLWKILIQLSDSALLNQFLLNSRDIKIFDPRNELPEAIATLYAELGNKSAEFWELWSYNVNYLLDRSEFAPKAPDNWTIQANLKCHCEDCKELKKFANNPELQTYNFRMVQDRRKHIEAVISSNNLDISCVTERKGSPHTLVCTKNRNSYKALCKEYNHDLTVMAKLNLAVNTSQGEILNLHARLNQALKNSLPTYV